MAEKCDRDLRLVMDRLVSRERELDMDLESGGTTSEEDLVNGLVSESRRNSCLDKFQFGPLSFGQVVNFHRVEGVGNENLELLVDKNSEGEDGQFPLATVDIKDAGENRKKKKSRKASKPPRPPKGPSLDAADQKLMQEIADLAIRKRARIERIRALKKMRAAKTSSWNNTLSAMVITALFFLILVLQGLSSRNSRNIASHGSPQQAVVGGDLISIQLFKNTVHDSDRSDMPHSSHKAELQVSSTSSRRI